LKTKKKVKMKRENKGNYQKLGGGRTERQTIARRGHLANPDPNGDMKTKNVQLFGTTKLEECIKFSLKENRKNEAARVSGETAPEVRLK